MCLGVTSPAILPASVLMEMVAVAEEDMVADTAGAVAAAAEEWEEVAVKGVEEEAVVVAPFATGSDQSYFIINIYVSKNVISHKKWTKNVHKNAS